jgi:SAM-dependent methyltransferase
MDSPAAKLREFIQYVRTHLSGDEKGEAHLYCEHLFQAFGHPGIREAGGTLEFRVHQGKGTRFADLLWRPRLLLEMKKRGEKLHKHYRQAFEYWLHLVPNRPQYVVLCNFDNFWVYDLNQQLDEPMDRVALDELPTRYTALNFLFPEARKPLFNNDRVAVTRAAADKVAQVFNLLVGRKDKTVPRDRAQRFILQSVIALFAQSIDLLPRGLFSELLSDCKRGGSSYDLLGALFRQMADPHPAEGGRFVDVPYFNGGLFAVVEPVELKVLELTLLAEAAAEDWSKINPAIFGTLFEGSMDRRERHAFGAHFTSEADIQKVVLPTIVRPWRQRIADARRARDLLDLREELVHFRVLDPACGSGNFLYVAYRELKRIEMELLDKIHAGFGERVRELAGGASLVHPAQFFGIDIKPFAVELAKVTLMLGKKLALDEAKERHSSSEHLFYHLSEPALPLENLDQNIRCDDALFCAWPQANAIIGNPPYQSKNKRQQAFGPDYVQKVRARYPGVPGRADYCVYWFRRAHDELPAGGRAGLVGTNTIRQNNSREGGLDYIVEKGGAITEAVSTQVWSGEAQVHVSIVNWVNGEHEGKRKLFFQKGDHQDSPWEVVEVDRINSSLSAGTDVSAAVRLRINMESGGCYQGQTHGHAGFLLSPHEARNMMADPAARAVIHPYLICDELLGVVGSLPGRYVIDLNRCDDLLIAKRHGMALAHVERHVMPDMRAKAEDEREQTGNEKGPRQLHFQRWWRFWRGRQEMMDAIGRIPRYVACGQVTKRPIFEFISSEIHPNAQLIVFPFPDDYSFGILQSGLHWAWFTAKCSTLTERFRYTSDTVFDTFPWPQEPELGHIHHVAATAVALRTLRRKVMAENNWSLRDLYRTLDLPGKNPLRDAHAELDAAVRLAYGMKAKADPLAFLLDLNHAVAQREADGQPITAPGLPPNVPNQEEFTTADCVQAPPLG